MQTKDNKFLIEIENLIGGEKLSSDFISNIDLVFTKFKKKFNPEAIESKEQIVEIVKLLSISEENLENVQNLKCLQRVWFTISGKNKKLERINKRNLLKVQKGSLFFLQKLAEQNIVFMQSVSLALRRINEFQIQNEKVKKYLLTIIDKYNEIISDHDRRISEIEKRMKTNDGLPEYDLVKKLSSSFKTPEIDLTQSKTLQELNLYEDLNYFLRMVELDKINQGRLRGIFDKLNIELAHINYLNDKLIKEKPNYDSLNQENNKILSEIDNLSKQLEKKEAEYEKVIIPAMNKNLKKNIEQLEIQIDILKNQQDDLENKIYAYEKIQKELEDENEKTKSALLLALSEFIARYYNITDEIYKKQYEESIETNKEINLIKANRDKKGKLNPLKILDNLKIKLLKSSLNYSLEDIKQKEIERLCPQLYLFDGKLLIAFTKEILIRLYPSIKNYV